MTHTNTNTSTGSAVRELKQCRQVTAAGGYVVVGERGRVTLARRNVRKALLREYAGYIGAVLAQCAVVSVLACAVLSALL